MQVLQIMLYIVLRVMYNRCTKQNKGVLVMPTTSLNIRTDSDVKEKAETLFAELGVNMTTAVNMFLRQAIRDQALPLELSLKSKAVSGGEGLYVREGKGEKDISDLFGKIGFADEYDYKALREGKL